MRSFVNRAYGRSRSLNAGLDDRLDTQDVSAFVARKLAEAARGVLRGHPGVYFSAGVTLRGRKHLNLGAGVALGPRVHIDATAVGGIALGKSVTCDIGAVLRGSGVMRNLGEGITVGPRSAVGAYNLILGQGGVAIGEDCLLGPGVVIVSEQHNTASREKSIRSQGETRAPVRIGNDVWLGAGVTVLAGADIGDGAIVAAGAVVRGRVVAGQVVGGVPAHFIRDR